MSDPFDLEQWARVWRGPMLRFALLHLQPREEAEDAVQDALAALLTADPATVSQADPRRYLFGILKHKVTDRLRAKYRPEVGYSEAFADDLDNVLFDERSHWAEGVAPSAWVAPDAQLQTGVTGSDDGDLAHGGGTPKGKSGGGCRKGRTALLSDTPLFRAMRFLRRLCRSRSEFEGGQMTMQFGACAAPWTRVSDGQAARRRVLLGSSP